MKASLEDRFSAFSYFFRISSLTEYHRTRLLEELTSILEEVSDMEDLQGLIELFKHYNAKHRFEIERVLGSPV